MAQNWGEAFAKGFSSSFESAQTRSAKYAEAKKERAGWDEWKQTEDAKKAFESMKLDPNKVTFNQFVNSAKWSGVTDAISSREFELDKKRRTQRKDELMDYAMGIIERPSESVMGQFSTGIGGINPQGQREMLPYVPKAGNMQQSRQAFEQAKIGQAMGVQGMQSTWAQSQKRASVLSSIESGKIILSGEFGIKEELPIKTREDVLVAIQRSGFNPEDSYWAGVLKKYPSSGAKTGVVGGAKTQDVDSNIYDMNF